MSREEPGVYAGLVNVPSTGRPGLKRIVPGDPENSYLFQKVADVPGIAGSRMPLGGPRPSDEDIEVLRRWIEAGAPNN